MSKLIATAAIRGAHSIYERADKMLQKAIAEKGKDHKFEFPDTAFYLPMIYAMTGFKVQPIPVIGPRIDDFLNSAGLGWMTTGLGGSGYSHKDDAITSSSTIASLRGRLYWSV